MYCMYWVYVYVRPYVVFSAVVLCYVHAWVVGFWCAYIMLRGCLCHVCEYVYTCSRAYMHCRVFIYRCVCVYMRVSGRVYIRDRMWEW